MKMPWECWKHPKYKRQYLKQWGKPNNVLTWSTGALYRFTRTVDLLMGDSVLDVGCGTGHLYHLVKDKMTYIGIDNTPSQIEIAKEFFPDGNFIVADLYDMPELPMCDSVVSLSVLLHLPDLPLTNLWKFTKKCLIFNMFIGPEEKVVKVDHPPYGYFLKHFYPKGQLIQLCKDLDSVAGVDFYESAISEIKGTGFAFIRVRRIDTSNTSVTS